MKRAWTAHAVSRSEAPRCGVVQFRGRYCSTSGVAAACDEHLAVRENSSGVRIGRWGHCPRGYKAPAVWVGTFGASEGSADVLAANDQYFSTGEQRRCVEVTTNAHAA